MSSISILDAKLHIGDIFERAASGESIIVTRDNKPFVRVLPALPEPAPVRIAETVDALFALQEQIRERTKGEPLLTDEEVRSARNEGRM